MVLKQKVKIRKIFMFSWIMILFAACQEEYVNISDYDRSVAFTSGDTIAFLVSSVTLRDGSYDNIIDRCNEVSIKFPYTIRVRNEEIAVTSMADIESIRQEYAQFINAITIRYPVTVIFSDYSESVLSNQGDLQKIKNQYNGVSEDDDIECIDFVYPIEARIYNTEFQKPDFEVVQDDKELHGIMKNMNDLIVEIGYPITVELFDSTTITIHNNMELEQEIMNAMGSCNEEDEVDFGGDE